MFSRSPASTQLNPYSSIRITAASFRRFSRKAWRASGEMLCPVRSKGMSEKLVADPGVCALFWSFCFELEFKLEIDSRLLIKSSNGWLHRFFLLLDSLIDNLFDEKSPTYQRDFPSGKSFKVNMHCVCVPTSIFVLAHGPSTHVCRASNGSVRYRSFRRHSEIELPRCPRALRTPYQTQSGGLWRRSVSSIPRDVPIELAPKISRIRVLRPSEFLSIFKVIREPHHL